MPLCDPGQGERVRHAIHLYMMMTAPLLLSLVLASAQLPAAPSHHTGVRALLSALGDDVKNLPSTENLVIASIGGGLALGAHPLDQTVNAHAIGQSDRVTNIFAVGKYVGDTPEQIAFSLGAWAFGRVMDKPRVSHLAMDLLRAQAITELLVEPVKFATHRQRPDGSNYQSFPSGHAAVTFAAAAVLQRHVGWKRSLGAYAVASFVAAARLQENRHYLSDVVFGAAVGTIAGRTVTRHGRENWTLVPVAVPGGVGAGVGVTSSNW
jgi:membrane-associated phospholipid phosphatase